MENEDTRRKCMDVIDEAKARTDHMVRDYFLYCFVIVKYIFLIQKIKKYIPHPYQNIESIEEYFNTLLYSKYTV